jgi:hypothetical protein
VGSIKYCGNCNPERDPRKVRKVLEEMAAATGSDVLILVNGCPRICLTKRTIVDPMQKVISLLVREVFENNKDPHQGGDR